MIENVEKNELIDLADIWMFDEQKETYQGYINIIKNKILECYDINAIEKHPRMK